MTRFPAGKACAKNLVPPPSVTSSSKLTPLDALWLTPRAPATSLVPQQVLRVPPRVSGGRRDTRSRALVLARLLAFLSKPLAHTFLGAVPASAEHARKARRVAQQHERRLGPAPEEGKGAAQHVALQRTF